MNFTMILYKYCRRDRMVRHDDLFDILSPAVVTRGFTVFQSFCVAGNVLETLWHTGEN